MYEPSEIRNVPLEEALKEGDNVRVSQEQIFQRGVDTRSGNFEVRDASNPRVFIGYQKDGFGTGQDYGIKVSQAGYNVETADTGNLIMSSGFNMFKIVSTGTAVINRPSAANDFATSSSVSHNLGYIPAYLAFIKPPSGYASGLANTSVPFFDYVLFDSVSGSPGWHINGLADVTAVTTALITFRLSFVLGNAGQIGDWTYRYYLLRETVT